MALGVLWSCKVAAWFNRLKQLKLRMKKNTIVDRSLTCVQQSPISPALAYWLDFQAI